MVDEKPDPNRAYYDKTISALADLFDKARAANELHFAMALMPEFRGMQDGGWNTAEEAIRTFDQLYAHINTIAKEDPARVRVTMGLYLHVAEGSGFYEIPKKLMLTIEGKGNNIWPFQDLVEKHIQTGTIIDPNANKIMKNMMGHAQDIGLNQLSKLFKEAIDPDLRNGIAHADYILVNDGVRIRKRNGGQPRIIPWAEFDALCCRAFGLFDFIRQFTSAHVQSYNPAKTIKARMNADEPMTDYLIYYVPETGAFGLTTGKEPPRE